MKATFKRDDYCSTIFGVQNSIGKSIFGSKRFLACLIAIIICFCNGAEGASKPMVALDSYHNNKTPSRYFWGDTSIANYSQFAKIIIGLGGDTMSIKTELDSNSLSPANILIIVDPDSPSMVVSGSTSSPNSKYISAAETSAVDKWVQRGGILMLLGNNTGNCEFTHLNQLSSQFGIHFNGDTYSGGYDLAPLPNHPFFTGCDTIHIKDMSTLTLTSPAQSVLTLNSKVLMATSSKGKGTVFALGDPWLYNEYINTKDNKKSGTNVMQWLFARIPGNVIVTSPRTLKKSTNTQDCNGNQMYSLNGRAINRITRQNAAGMMYTSVSGKVKAITILSHAK